MNPPGIGRVSHHQSLSEFVSSTGRNNTGVELDANVRMVLWVSLGLLVAPVVLWAVSPLFDGDALWFGNGIVATWIPRATSQVAMIVCGALAVVIIALLLRAAGGTPGTPLLAGSAVSVAGAGVAAVPTTVVVIVVVANLIAIVVAAIAIAVAVWAFVAGALDQYTG